jgi:hypothetical protein
MMVQRRQSPAKSTSVRIDSMSEMKVLYLLVKFEVIFFLLVKFEVIIL